MSQDYLTGLALLNIHHTITLNVDDVFHTFADSKKKKYRHSFVN